MKEYLADRPIQDPEEDLFGHAPFAKNLSDSIRHYSGEDCFVLALYGPWGSGKSTVLNYVEHYLRQCPANKQLPVLIKFNPWWFSGQENLARAFLGQLQAVLPAESERFEQLGNLLAEFSEEIGGLMDHAGVSYGAGKYIGKLLGKLKRKPKSMTALKKSISDLLRKEGKRILVIIDDIDRLTPEETRQLFTVIKALADFPNVIYLLAFDREVVAQAIGEQSGLPGDRYLEKIIQVALELPAVDRVALRRMFFKRLDEVLGEVPEETFDQSYWTNVYHAGIDAMIQVPRDVVRLTNALSVTYPSVRGEVNTVDFIALESLRVFLPDVYDTVRSNPNRFSGHGGDDQQAQKFHEKWMNEVPEALRSSTRALLERIFPRISQMGYGAEWLTEWQQDMRACHPDLFPTFFRFTVPAGTVRRSEVMALLDLAGTPADFGNALVKAKEERRPDGLSKARALLERLMDNIESDIPDKHIPMVIQALLDVGDSLIDPADEHEMFDVGNVVRAMRPVYHLLKRVEVDQRADVLKSAIQVGDAVAVQLNLLEIMDAEDADEIALLTADEFEQLKKSWLCRVRTLSVEANFVLHPKLPSLLVAWGLWGSKAEVRTWCDAVTVTDEGLLKFLQKFLRYTKSQTVGDWAVCLQPRLNPASMEDYLDTATCADRLRDLQRNSQVPDSAQVAVSQYLKEFDILQEGKNPNHHRAFDE